jgi:hypothetical protein
MAFRTDLGTLRPARKRADGTVVVDAFITRAGIFTYMNADGSLRRELRDPKEVFDSASMRSFDMLTVTNTHPYQMVDAKNARQFMVGANDQVQRDDDHLRTQLMVADAATINEMADGSKAQVSCGYTCDYIAEPGVHPKWGKYDGRQTKIRGNHIALVTHARAGETARVRMDDATDLRRRADYSAMQSTTAMFTSIVDGHQHSLDPQSVSNGVGWTSWAIASGASEGHSHDWIRNADGSITISENSGHTHTAEGLVAPIDLGAKADARGSNNPTPSLHRDRENRMPQPADPTKTPDPKATMDAAAKLVADEKLRADAAVLKLAEAEKLIATETARADAAEGRGDVLQTQLDEAKKHALDPVKLDEANEKIKTLEAEKGELQVKLDIANDPKRLDALVQERSAIERAARRIGGERYVIDGISNRDLRIDLLQKVGVLCDPKESDEKVTAKFEVAVLKFDSSEDAAARIRVATNPNPATPVRADNAQTARQAMEERNRNAWKPTPTR